MTVTCLCYRKLVKISFKAKDVTMLKAQSRKKNQQRKTKSTRKCGFHKERLGKVVRQREAGSCGSRKVEFCRKETSEEGGQTESESPVIALTLS